MTLQMLKDFAFWLAGCYLVALLIQNLLSLTPLGRDDTDAGRWGGGRSGVKPVTDALTGCQYLITRDGGITPRLDADGKHICEVRRSEGAA